MEAKIRAATPDDAPFLAWVMQEAARSHLPRGMWDLVFPEQAQRLEILAALARAEPRCFCHHAGFLVSELEGRPAAALSAYVPGRVGSAQFVEALRGILADAGWSAAQMSALAPAFAAFQAATPEIPDDAWCVEWVATRPEFRGRGLVRALLERILDQGRGAGHETAVIGILIGNTPARRAYEKVGFRMYAERRSGELEGMLGTPGTAQLRMRLAGASR